MEEPDGNDVALGDRDVTVVLFLTVLVLGALFVLVLSTVGIAVFAWVWFRFCEHVARSRGLIDWKTNY